MPLTAACEEKLALLAVVVSRALRSTVGIQMATNYNAKDSLGVLSNDISTNGID